MANVVRAGSDTHRLFEDELRRDGRPLSLPHRSSWLEAHREHAAWFVAVRGPEHRAAFGFAVTERASRLLPGHRVWRAWRVEVPSDAVAFRCGLQSVVDFARAHGRVLSLAIELFDATGGAEAAVARTCAAVGLAAQPSPRSYRETLLIDLAPMVEDLFSSLHATARRHVRAVSKNGLMVRPVTSDHASRMTQLVHETMSRSGGPRISPNWSALFELAQADPSALRLVGLFNPKLATPDDLMAFAVGYNHGHVAEYATAGSTRQTDLKMPLGYALAWDLITWAKATGAGLFDFGGITAGSHGSQDRLGGISDFKRYFSDKRATVGHEWYFEPSPVRAGIVRFIRKALAKGR